MAALAPSRTNNPQLLTIAGRITASQKDEMRFMRDWLKARGAPAAMPAMDHAAIGPCGNGSRRDGPWRRAQDEGHGHARPDGCARRRQGRLLRPPVPRTDDRPPSRRGRDGRGPLQAARRGLRSGPVPVHHRRQQRADCRDQADGPAAQCLHRRPAGRTEGRLRQCRRGHLQPHQARFAAPPGGLLRPRQPRRPRAAQGQESRQARRRADCGRRQGQGRRLERTLAAVQLRQDRHGLLRRPPVRRQLSRLQRLPPRRRRHAARRSARSSAPAGRATSRSSATSC